MAGIESLDSPKQSCTNLLLEPVEKVDSMSSTSNWISQAAFLENLEAESIEMLSTLKPGLFEKGSVLFRPGEAPKGFVMVLSGRIGVYLTGKSGREIMLYEVNSGETCVQTTIGILGGQYYSGEAIAETDVVGVIVPLPMFSQLMADSSAFRFFVFRAFGNRLSEITHLLEQVAFVTIERRLCDTLIQRAQSDGVVPLTHQELSAIIGSAREVISRRLEILREQGLVELDRGKITIINRAGLARLLSI